jgi:hypothetical protein
MSFQCRWCSCVWDELPDDTKFISVGGMGRGKFKLVVIDKRAHSIVKKSVISVEPVPLAEYAEFNPEPLEIGEAA